MDITCSIFDKCIIFKNKHKVVDMLYNPEIGEGNLYFCVVLHKNDGIVNILV